jgi:cysteine synthase A
VIFDDNSFTIGRTPLVRPRQMTNGSGAAVLAKIEGRNLSAGRSCEPSVQM